jgi:hypothetical protein
MTAVGERAMRSRWLTGLAVAIAFGASASEAPSTMTKFNQVCPAKRLLPQLETQYQSCKRNQPVACEQFVATFRELLPEYDCQRPFDATPTVNYIVPAIWLSRDHDKYVALLSKLKVRSAQELFASPELRRTLDGHIAEMYLDQSEELEKKLRGK